MTITRPTYALPLLGGNARATKESHDAEINRVLGELYSNDTYVNGRIDGVIATGPIVGSWNPATGAFPTTRPDGSPIQRGDTWRVIGSGTVGGETFAAGDYLQTTTDGGGATFSGHWSRAALGQIAEDRAAAEAAASQAAAYNQGPILDSVPALAADTTMSYSPAPGKIQVAAGQTIRTRDGFAYMIRPLGSSDFDWATAGGVLLYLLPSDAGHYNFAGMAPANDGVTDDFPKLKRLLDRPQAGGTSWYRSILPIYLPMGGRYYMSRDIQLKRSVHLYGDGSGMRTDAAPTLIFPPDCAGITVNRHNTLDGGKEATPTTAADASLFEGFNLLSTVGADKSKHGLWLRARATVRRMRISGFSGNGLNIVATAGSANAAEEGNANNFYVEYVTALGNGGTGFYIRGADTNAGVLISCDASDNGRSGFEDRSFLGNTHIGHHVAFNGNAGSGANGPTKSSFVSFGGSHYAAHWLATEAQLVATEPGTDSNVWVLRGGGGVHPRTPLWVADSPEGTYFPAFGYLAVNDNARNVFLGCYWESGSSGNAFPSGPTMLFGGSLGWVMVGDYARKTSTGAMIQDSLALNGPPGLVSAAASVGATTNVPNRAYSFTHPEESGSGWALLYTGGEWVWRNNNLGARTPILLTDGQTTRTFGTPDPIPYMFMVNGRLGLGSGAAARRITYGSPVGVVAAGDVFLGGASPGGKVGQVCTTGGTVGSTAVMKPFGAIDA